MKFFKAFLVVLVPLATACVVGIDPPPATERVLVTGGIFPFGSELVCTPASAVKERTCEDGLSGYPKVYPTVDVELKPFMADIHEVTNAQYRYCVEMGSCPLPKFGNTQNIEFYWDNPMYADYPVINITQASAEAYCNFMDGRLPTEIEWERMAGGPGTLERPKRVYPAENLTWKMLSQCRSKLQDINVAFCANRGNPEEVMKSDNDYVLENGKKIFDLAGNVAEWVSGGYVEGVTCQETLDECDCWACTDDNCRANCYTTCTACSEAGDACHVVCADAGLGLGLPVCLKYTDPVKPADLFEKGKNGMRLAKGGDYEVDVGQSCRVAVASRLRVFKSIDDISPTTGFRCVADVATEGSE
ncbi:MAG TPA: formylglycine-generating enzyme family protein [Myxococcota bacterium]|nr:formylglycine-generating enzyme family protein [Myxococcota bacterium]HOA12365.1 formylglycine-generating enzyme family protein [Myxococcota bacterium]HOC99619.1 formylglycine-generating enzyme family protein [Myxococcota bacterium]HOH75670.1 formylglycine-generating enzyme family protein [Myxococcota bacterium]HPV03872.1 formylglycine-generating enzyme family protein [Myxococcota bacterium]